MIRTLLRWSAGQRGSPKVEGAAATAAPSNRPSAAADAAEPLLGWHPDPPPHGDGHGPPSSDEVAECVAGGHYLWLDVQDPTPDELDRLRREFAFHPLAIEDALNVPQRPKIDEYPGYFFMVFYAIGLSRPGGDVTLQQVGMFLGPTFLIMVHNAPAPAIAESARRWERNKEDVGRSIGAVVYSVLDALVDGYFPVVDDLVERIERVEEEILSTSSRETLAHLFALKRDLLRVRKVAGPERDVLNVLIRREAPVVDAQTGLYLQDVYDHIIRVTDSIDLYRDLLASALDAYLSVQSNTLNQVMKRMTAISTILMSLALVAGIYGMNFKAMPELDWVWGYPYALGLMACLGVGMTLFFRRIGWF